jgi:hypothetical protein
VVSLTVKDVMKITRSSIEAKQQKLMFMLLAAFITRCVSALINLSYDRVTLNNRCSLVLFLFREIVTFRSFDSSQKGNAHIDWKVQEWQITHGISSSAVGNPFPLNVQQ